MGEVEVPADALWGAQTQRAVANFPVSGQQVEPALIRALALVKAAAARTNADLGVVDHGTGEAIAAAAEEVAAGEHADHFPVDVFQTGSGTSTNMNVNEVVARLAGQRLGRPVHPNDAVNASQSSNDAFPTALHVAAGGAVVGDVIPALWHLHGALERQAQEYADAVKPGRTHLMDAAPVTLGQELAGHAAQVAYGVERLEATLPRVLELPLGGTAVGTGLNAPAGFAEATIGRLRASTGLAFTEARNHFEAQGARDAMVELSGQLRVVALGLAKIANDLRWMGSGPRAGLAEVALPDLQPGSSIMPGKVNPVVPEAVVMVAAQVVGNDAAVAHAASTGMFELNTAMPVIARNVLESERLLTNAARLLADRAVDGMTADVARMRAAAESSPAIVTPLALRLGYDEAAAIVKQALSSGSSIADVVRARGHVDAGRISEQELAADLDVDAMARGRETRP